MVQTSEAYTKRYEKYYKRDSESATPHSSKTVQKLTSTDSSSNYMIPFRNL